MSGTLLSSLVFYMDVSVQCTCIYTCAWT